MSDRPANADTTPPSTDAPTVRTPGDLRIVIRNCNSIETAAITLRPKALNIKYGPNGLGKSTIARALTLHADKTESLDQLVPFRHRATNDGKRPSVEGADGLTSVLTFNDSYVSQFAFQHDEVLKDSFEIFINTPDYREGLEQIESIFESLKRTFVDQKEFSDAITAFSELRDAFNVTKAGTVAKNSKGYRALGVAAKLTNIPEPLHGYRGFIESSDPAGWISWQAKGKEYLGLSDNCPYCSTPQLDKGTALLVSAQYDSTAVRNMGVLRAVLDRLGKYISPSQLEQLGKITSSVSGLKDEQAQFLANLRGDIGTFLTKLSALRSLSFHALHDTDIRASLNDLTIDLDSLPALKSEATTSVVGLINDQLRSVANRINEVQERIGKQKKRVAKLISKNQDAINGFLNSAGYRYSVRIEAQQNSYRMLLEHEDAVGHIPSASSHLSYGEKNAFALVLFMHHAQSIRPDLVILDDPVSSFDKTKKFAILHQLFRGKNSLRGLTSLLLTHDIEPAIDIVRTGTSNKFQAALPVVHFLSGRGGTVTETMVEPSDIATFTEVCKDNIRTADDPVVKCIYLRRRYEMHGEKGLEYDLLSSLLHLRITPTTRSADMQEAEMTAAERAQAENAIRDYIPDFEYGPTVSALRIPGDIEERFHATDVGYEKLQLFRSLAELHPALLGGDDVFGKFIKETYHIENEYVMQLNPRKFDAVPEFVIEACRERITTLTERRSVDALSP